MTRTKNIKFRVTEAEHRRLKALAGARGVSAFLRRRALGPDRHQEKIERLAVLRNLTMARNTLNQIARISERRPPVDQLQIVLQLVAVERTLLNFKKS